MAATFPQDVEAAAAWSKANSKLQGDAAVKAVASEPWDPSVQSLVAFPQVLATMASKPDWVTQLGNAFIAQPNDVMDSVQRLRKQAQQAGNLKSNEQQKVVVEQTTIQIQPTNPQVVYVPTYNPTVVYNRIKANTNTTNWNRNSNVNRNTNNLNRTQNNLSGANRSQLDSYRGRDDSRAQARLTLENRTGQNVNGPASQRVQDIRQGGSTAGNRPGANGGGINNAGNRPGANGAALTMPATGRARTAAVSTTATYATARRT
jgi:hypothetical protein